MDPNACLQLILSYLGTGDFEEAQEPAENLLGWIQSGGFEPAWPANWTDIELPNGLGNLDDYIGEVQWARPEFTAAQMNTTMGDLRALIIVLTMHQPEAV